MGYVCQPLDPSFHQSGSGEVNKIHGQFATFEWVWPCLQMGISRLQAGMESDAVLNAF